MDAQNVIWGCGCKKVKVPPAEPPPAQPGS